MRFVCVNITKLTVTLVTNCEVKMDCICYGGPGKIYLAYRNKIVLAQLKNDEFISFGKNIRFSEDNGKNASTIKSTYL